MRAHVERLTGTAADEPLLARAAALIRAGELVAFPTETVYGLGANALDEAAVAKIFAAKGRPFADPLIVHLASADEVGRVARSVPDVAQAFMRAFWPGPLTLILPRASTIPLRVTAGRDTVAVRVPAHPIAHELLVHAGVPIAAPSANRFSRPSPTTAAHVAEDLGDELDLILDGGPTSHGVESTVLDLSGDTPTVLRPGAITLEALRGVVTGVALGGERQPDGALTSPGTLLKHYSPRADVRLWGGELTAARDAMRQDAIELLAAGHRVGALVVDEDAAAFEGLAVTIWPLGSMYQFARVASRLYEGLRELDRTGVDVILARDPGRDGLALTIRDRLFRAAEGRVLDSRNRMNG